MDISNYKNTDGIQKAANKQIQKIKFPEKLTPSQWAESNVYIPVGNAMPGLYKLRRTPFHKEILDMAGSPDTNRISLMWAAQTGKTTCLLAMMGYFIDHDPSPIMALMPTQTDMNVWLHGKFNPMVDASPSLTDKFVKARSREGVNNQTIKQFAGGNLFLAWAGSANTLRSRSVRVVMADETDGYEITSEGHPVSLAQQRTATFGKSSLMVCTSTPTIKGASHIETSFEEGDKRRWFCPCPVCGGLQYLKWKHVQWNKGEDGEHDPKSAYYECEHCGEHWDDIKRHQAVKAGEWIAEKPFKGHASYHLPEMCSLFRDLSEIVQSFLEKKDAGDLRTFVNVSLGETWEEEGDTIEPHVLQQRAEIYDHEVPDGVLCLTAAVDVQKDRIELGVEGWGKGFENWKIDYRIIHGDPNLPDVWQDLDDALNKTYEGGNGQKFRIASAFIDSGYLTDRVYQFTRPRLNRRIYAIKGVSGSGRPVIGRSTKSAKERATVLPLGTDTIKDVVMGRLQVKEVGPSYSHFPANVAAFDAEYYEQLTAEHAVTEYQKGYAKRVWKAKRARNEAFDIACYNLACVTHLSPDFEAMMKRLIPKEPEPEPEDNPMAYAEQRAEQRTPPAKRKVKLRRRKSSFLV